MTSQSPRLLVIDGQQRLTTMSSADCGAGQGTPMSFLRTNGSRCRGLRRGSCATITLVNPEEEDEQTTTNSSCPRPTKTRSIPVLSLTGGWSGQEKLSRRISGELTEHFETWIAAGNGEQLTPLARGSPKLVVVDIALNRDQDNPQLIFESMNSTGRELTQADLIRNFILMGLEPAAKCLRELLAPYGTGFRTGGLRDSFRQLHAALPLSLRPVTSPDCATYMRHSRHTPDRPK